MVTPMKLDTKKIDRIEVPTGVLDLDVTADSRWVYVAALDGVYRIDCESTSVQLLDKHPSYVSGVALADEDQRLVSAGYDGCLQFRDLSNLQSDSLPLEPVRTENAHSFWSWKLAASPDRKRVASVSGQYLAGGERYEPLAATEPTVKVYDSLTGEPLHAFEFLPSVQAVAFDPSGRFLAAGNLMGDIAVWDLTTGKLVTQWRTPDFTSWGIIKSHCYIGGIHALMFSADGKSLYAAGMGEMRDPMAGNGRQLWQQFDWNLPEAKKIRETERKQAGEGLMETLVLHPSGDWFVMAGRLRGGDWNVGFFSVADGSRIGFLKTDVRVTSARFGADGKTFYLGGLKNQGKPNDKGEWPKFGIVDRYQVSLGEMPS